MSKGRKLFEPINPWLLVIVAVAAVVIVSQVANADECAGKSSACANQIVDIAGDDSLGVGLGLSYGMGDVDINEGQNCMGSEQKANIIWGSQELVLNAWCASLFYELNGKHEFAAKLRCEIPEILVHYDTAEKCAIDQELTAANVPQAPDLSGLYDRAAQFDEHYELAQRQEQEIEYLQEESASMVGRIEQLVAYIDNHSELVIVQQKAPQYTDEQVSAVWAALKGSDEDE